MSASSKSNKSSNRSTQGAKILNNWHLEHEKRLDKAIREDDLDEIEAIFTLKTYDINLELRSDGNVDMTPLMLVVCKGSNEGLEMILEHPGIDLMIT